MHDLYQHLAACDLAVVQGGLTTAMELTANQRPFLCFPLRHHFEQNFHVRHRLERYGAGRYMDFETDGPEQIADAIAAEIGREVDYSHVETDGARARRRRSPSCSDRRRGTLRRVPAPSTLALFALAAFALIADPRAEHAVRRGAEHERGPPKRAWRRRSAC